MSDIKNNILLQLKLTKNIIENEHNKYLKPYDISNEQGLLLKVVYEMPGLSQTQIAEELHKDKTTITRTINTLIKKGKLMRKSSHKDKRVYKIYVTEKTKENVKRLTPIFQKQNEDLRYIIGKSDYDITIKVLEKIKKYYLELNK